MNGITYIVLMADHEAMHFTYAAEAKHWVFSGNDRESATAILELRSVAGPGFPAHGIFADVTGEWAREIAAGLSDDDIRAGVWVHPLARNFVRDVKPLSREEML